ncbi:MAG TPA: ABC transporter ATP-binding protein [Pseudonocardia sp.]|nr:ABC transporter ATP-binding protein [Pseudonocardia sp.]
MMASYRSIYRRFWPLTAPIRGWFYLSLLLVVIVPMLSTAGIGMFKVLIDRVVIPHDYRLFPQIAAIYIGLTAVQSALGFADQYLTVWIGERFVLSLRTKLFGHMHSQSSDFFEDRPLGDLLSRLTGDVNAIEALMLSGIAQGVAYIVKLVMFTGAMLLLDWRLAIAAIIAVPGYLMVGRLFSRRIKVASREKRRRYAAITSVAEESLANAALVRTYDRASGEQERFRTENLAVWSAQMIATRLQASFASLNDLVEVVGILLVVGIAVHELTAGRLTIGGLLVFMAYMSRLYGPIQGFSGLINAMHAASAGAERVVEILDVAPTVVDPNAPTPLGRATGNIRIHNATFTYPSNTEPALSGLDVSISAGQRVAIVGSSGAGKSTLTKLVLRLVDPQSGSVTLDGIDLRQLSREDLYRNIATVLQETLVFDGTVRENILWGRPDAGDEEIVRAARAADAHQFITELADGYDTRIGQRGRKISGGQRQRIAVARALIRDAPVLLLDEPTTGLDGHSTQRVLDSLTDAMAARTVIVISHNLATVTEADLVVFLEQGQVADHGTHTELMARSAGYRQLYERYRESSQHPGHDTLEESAGDEMSGSLAVSPRLKASATDH